jgi:hypothetical protein
MATSFKDLRAKWAKAKADGEAFCKKNKLKPPAFTKGDMGPLMEALDLFSTELAKRIAEVEKILAHIYTRSDQAIKAGIEYKKGLATLNPAIKKIYDDPLSSALFGLNHVREMTQRKQGAVKNLKVG